MTLPRHGSGDLIGARERILRGETSATALLESAIAAADGPAAQRAFIRRFDALARATAAAVDALKAAGAPLPPLAGLSLSIKELFDLAGSPTTAGSAALAGARPASQDCPAVARLRRAGAALLGHSNLSEFAFSGVGINPHHGTPVNAGTLAFDDALRVPGGSTSGGATSVAAGAAWAALGSDTGGSIRIPAALQGLVGFKNTQRLTPLEGSVPLSFTLDTSCAITRSVRDAVLIHELLADRRVHLPGRPLKALRLAVPRTLMLDDLEPAVANSFDQVLVRLRDAGARIELMDLPQLSELPAIHARGTLAAAEAWCWHRKLLEQAGDKYDRRVALRIRGGESMSAADYISLLQARRAWIASVETALQGFDAALSPTVPIVAPPVEPLIANDEAFFAVNGKLLRNTLPVNFLDGCALSLPCHAPGTLPVGLMIWGPAMSDDAVLGASLAIEQQLQQRGD
jgi:amidase/aspartyl-tRNA(Asn)/glutamyl-tRNA(Gln) amidotransferase subunit A